MKQELADYFNAETEKLKAAQKLETMTLAEIASVILRDHRTNGKKLYFGAVPYVDAMQCFNSIKDDYGADSGRSVVAYALSNLSTWRGDVARAVKVELNKRLKQK